MQVDQLVSYLTPVVDACGLEIDRIEIRSAGKRKLVQIFLDGDSATGGGISLDDIGDATRAISRALDESDVTGSFPYTLEVSTRGVNRPLTEAKHYRRNIGRKVHIWVAEDEMIAGRIEAVFDEGVQLTERNQLLPFTTIVKAVIQVEMGKLEA